ncbi:hypothetical protein FFLO_06566 [Filobasidium floriforme]|uniref:non-reducing end alpha-L-arabinofuranosidase n=1 Tax=Filobasidium floriforme TaxID=5210 RepID=A0A8K0NMQ8_9TREE|nr:glycoside hydrolase superfamily [Filobasidium floriforme]KAG7527823.1 hypothetical protein FFLO_06566 [Filobasidium floriforme]KAH8084000.1 glycoside hydrolase superfamily [Filobasidium floriforme]
MAGIDPYAAAPPKNLNTTERVTFDHPKTLSNTTLSISPRSLVYPAGSEVVSDKLYSGFIEHLGRGIYGGIVDDDKNPSDEKLLVKQDDGTELTKGRLGWRKDVMDVIGKEGELEMPMLRWPGGNYVSNWHWQDCVGPIQDRPKRIELAWLSEESNHFGLNEFVDYARGLGVEPYLCLNMGTGTFEEALSLLEYCNGKGNTHWANLRRKHTGRDEPHDIKLWGLGNEMHGPWQVGHLSAADYTKQAARWAHALRLVDPSIKLVSCGNQGNSEWDREVLQGLIGVCDYHSIHFYSMLGHERFAGPPGLEYEKNVFGPIAAERGIEICSSLIDLAKIHHSLNPDQYKFGLPDSMSINSGILKREMKICYDEWNVWDETKAPGSVGLEQSYEYVDMLGVCAWLNILVRKSKDVGIACIAQSVNVISPVMTSPTGLLFQTTYYPLRLFAKYMKGGELLNLGFTPDAYTGPTYPVWIQHLTKPAYVDVVAIIVHKPYNENSNSKKARASIRLSVLNRHPEAAWEGVLRFDHFDVEGVEVHSMYHDDMSAVNTFEKPNEVVPTVEKLEGKQWKGTYTVKKHSWSFFIFEGTVQE